MISNLPPGIILIVGALLLPVLRGRLRQLWWLLLPLASGLHMVLYLPAGTELTISIFDYELTPFRIDRLSLVWGYIFHIAAFLGAVFSLHVKDATEQFSAASYVGAAIGGVFAGDLITLFVYWELTAITSVFLIWVTRTQRAYRAGMRYVIIQVGSGVLLLAGVLFHFHDTGSLAFGKLGLVSVGTTLIFIAFGIKAAFPFLHNWLQDAYPESTPTGTLYLSIFTTKLAIYALARGFAGTECLILIGAAMTAFPIFFAVIENDLRRVLAYSLNNQLGFMVVGIGIGTEMALNGAAAYAFANIVFEGLLFMAMGAVLLRTGTCKGSELGGLYKSMPLTTAFCIVGAASISAFPFLSGFVTKSLILSETAATHHTIAFLVLLFASAGVFHHSGIKIPFFAFFAHDAGYRVKEAPLHMLIAMASMAILSILIGIFPEWLYALLPYPVDYEPYTTTHVITQYQILLFSALAFTVLKRTGIYPPELRSTNLDFDWTYRRVLPAAVRLTMKVGEKLRYGLLVAGERVIEVFYGPVYRLHGPQGVFSRTWSTGAIAFWAVLGLCLYLIFYLW